MTTFVLVDDHMIVRQGVRMLLESESNLRSVGEAGDGPQALELLKSTRPDVLITDLMMQGMSGVELIKEVKKAWPEIKCIVLSMYDDPVWAIGALDAGASGYVIKDSGAEDLCRAVRTVMSGEVFLSPPLAEKIGERRHRLF